MINNQSLLCAVFSFISCNLQTINWEKALKILKGYVQLKTLRLHNIVKCIGLNTHYGLNKSCLYQQNIHLLGTLKSHRLMIWSSFFPKKKGNGNSVLSGFYSVYWIGHLLPTFSYNWNLKVCCVSNNEIDNPAHFCESETLCLSYPVP